MTDSEKKAGESPRLGREFIGLFFILCGLLLLLSLATFDSRDPWLNHVVSGTSTVYNRAGRFGAYTSGTLFDFLGIGAWTIPFFFCLIGARRVLSARDWPWWRWGGFFLMLVCFSLLGAARDVNVVRTLQELSAGGDVSRHGGGLLGHALYKGLMFWLSAPGTILVGVFAFFLAIQLIVGFSWVVVVVRFARAMWRTGSSMAENMADFKARPKEPEALEASLVVHDVTPVEAAGEGATGGLFPEENPRLLNAGKTSSESSLAFRKEKAGQGAEPDLPPWVCDFENDFLEGRADSDDEEASPEAEQFAPGTEYIESVQPAAPRGGSSGASSEAGYAGSIPIGERPEIKAADSEPKSKGLLDRLRKPELVPLPGVSLLEAMPPTTGTPPRSVLEAKGRALMGCLNDFGIQSELVGITPGPVVTMFEVRPAPGVRVSRIASLSDDLALALKAVAVRIQAPVPGTDTVGIEIPNEVRETVCFKELIGSEVFRNSSSLLTLALGKDIAGHPVVANLGSMPHLLMAGATGAGKSVGINSIILSLLYKARPEEVKLLLVDPKRVEMAIYADLPHLVHPVVTEMNMAKNALAWAVMEMEKRYADIARAAVRNIADYNAKLKELGDKRPEGMEDLEFMPYLVIIIDELADLMMTAAKEVEQSVVRLAQLARAAGIHLILATQRPSVDVVTGLIKANFPSRISFQVSSKHDSRTILDAGGAEQLLGRGDMLYKPSGGRFLRLHGAFVSDKHVLSVTDYWRSKQKPSYAIDFSEWGADDGDAGGLLGSGDMSDDPIYQEAVEFVRQQGRASISLIQRRFRIGFNKAARLVEQMEHDGIIGPADGSKPRMVIR